MDISMIAANIPASPIRSLVTYSEKAKAEGAYVYHLNIGDPDIKTPDPMLKILKNWRANPVRYSNSQGEKILLTALVGYYKHLGVYLSEAEVQVTVGGSEGLLWTFMTVCNPGDEIITFEPFYANYNSYAVMTGINLVPVLTTIDTGFHLPDRDAITKKISSKTRAILICNPSNPTGTVYTKSELTILYEIAREHDLYLIGDEVYREFAYDSHRAESVLTFSSAYPEGIIMVDSLSKRYSLCGARIGSVVSKNKKIMESLLRYAQARLSAGFIDQTMAAALSSLGADYFSAVVRRYEKRRDCLIDELSKIPGLICHKPEGAFYTIVNLPVRNSAIFARWLLTDFRLNNETVMIAPAAGFYKTPGLGADQVRIAYVLSRVALQKSTAILKAALATYQEK